MHLKIIEKNIGAKILLIVLLLFHLLNNYIWLSMDKSCLAYNSFHDHIYSLKIYNMLSGISPFDLSIFLDIERRYGILVGIVTAPFYFIFGRSQDAGVMVAAAIFLSVLIFSIYGIGKKLFNRTTGLLAAFMITMYPSIFCYLRRYMLELPLTAMVTLSIYMILLSDSFRNKKYTLAFALTAALGMLIKINFIGYIIGPLIIALYYAFRTSGGQSTTHKLSKKRNIFVALGIIIVALLFYLLKFQSIAEHFFYLNRADYFLFKCIQDLVNKSISFLFFSVFLIGFYFFCRVKLREKSILFLWLSLPLFCLYVLFYQGSIVTYKYIMSALPSLALISAIGIMNIKYNRLKKILISLIVVLGTIQFFAVSYGIDFLPEKITIPSWGHLFGGDNDIVLFNQKISYVDFGYNYKHEQGNISQPLSVDWEKDWKIEEISDVIINPSKLENGISTCFIDHIPEEAFNSIIYKAFIERGTTDRWYDFSRASKAYLSIEQGVLNADYVIKRSRYFNKYFVTPSFKTAKMIFSQNMERFNLLKVIRLFDGSKLTIYENKQSAKEIKQGHLKLYFSRDGKCKLYYRNKEITKQAGLNISFEFQGDYCNSLGTIWQIDKLALNKLIAKGVWPDLPLIQIWQIELLENNIVNWQIEIEVKEGIAIKQGPYVNLILSPDYQKWVNLNNQGTFSGIPLWQKRWSWVSRPSSSICIGVKGNRRGTDALPGVLLKIEEGLILERTVAQNTDYSIRARALNVQRQEDMGRSFELDIGKHRIFSGQIVVFEKDKDFNLFLRQTGTKG